MALLFQSSRRYFLRHPWQSGLAVLGITVAVAVVVGIDLANVSARRAFQLSVEGVAGRATHEITGGASGLDEAIYSALRTAGWQRLAPVVEGWVTRPEERRRPLRLFGIDPFAEALFRDFTRNLRQGESTGDLGAFLTEPGAVVLGADLAQELGLRKGGHFDVVHAGRHHQLVVVGVLEAADRLARRSGRDLLVADMATAQEILGQEGRLSRIDILFEAGEEGAAALLKLLPLGTGLTAKTARSDTLEQMTRAFRLNLEALSLLALLVGMFLIYNTMTFSVVRRRRQLGILRAMGVTRREVFALVLGEAALMGLVGSAVGVGAGILLAQSLLHLVTRTINDLYFVLNVSGMSLSPTTLAKGLVLGVLGTVLAALLPAIEATRAAPRAVLVRSQLERQVRKILPRLGGFGIILIITTFGLLALPSKSLVLSFAAIFLLTLGCACLVPPLTFGAAHLLRPAMTRLFGLLGSMAARGVASNLSRTGVAVTALVIAVAMSIGVGVMVRSFRTTLVDWLEVTLVADIYVAPTDISNRGPSKPLDPSLVERLTTAPGVEYSTTFRRLKIDTDLGPATLMVLGIEPRAFRSFTFVEGGREEVWRRFEQGEVIISEPYAYHHDLTVGDEVELLTDRGRQRFPVAGVYYNYASERGIVSLHRQTWGNFWDGEEVQTLGLYTAPGVDPDRLIEDLRQQVGSVQSLTFSPNRALRRGALEIFDRTFLITGVLRTLALGVAFLGILSALMALQLERAREVAVLRTIGLTPRQVWALMTAQTGLMGLIAGLLSVPLGLALALLLLEVINRRAFGWTLLLDPSPGVCFQAVLLAVVAALLAGLYPAYRMARSSPALALREE
jgi:putative ABC transport system permease protein